MESREFHSYLDARLAILAEGRLENTWAYNFAKLTKDSKKKIKKRWEKEAYGWRPKKKLSLKEAISKLGNVNGN